MYRNNIIIPTIHFFYDVPIIIVLISINYAAAETKVLTHLHSLHHEYDRVRR